MFFDTHAHYDDEQFETDREAVIASLPETGVSLVLNAGTDVKTSVLSIQFAEKFPFVYAAVGVHPHQCDCGEMSSLDSIRSLAENSRVKAIGEIGLDYYYDTFPRSIQKDIFANQLDLSEQLKLPVIIHDRDAHKDTLDIISSHHSHGVVHCFSGSLEMAKILLDMGWYLSFNGVITFKNAKKAVEIVNYMPLDRILIETDSPYLTPEPFRGSRNNSSYVRLVAQKIADIKGLSVEDVAAATLNNGKMLFNINP